MSSEVTFEEAQRQIGQLPSVGPRPNATNIRNLEVALFDSLEGIPSQQSHEYGYKGMAQQLAEYALISNDPWIPFPNPGNHRVINPALTAQQQRDEDALYAARRIVWVSQDNVQRASIAALNVAVPKEYKRTNGIGTANYKTNQSIRDILGGLRDVYGVPTPDEVTTNETNFARGWDPNEPIENFLHRLEDAYLKSVIMQPPFTMEQMIYKAKTAVMRTGLYPTAMLEWNNFLPANQTWPELKLHFTEAYDLRIRTGGGGTTGANGYHAGFNAYDDDDDSLASIQASIHNQMQSLQLANNATSQATNDSISALTAETRQLSAALLATQQQLAMFTRGGPPALGSGWPATTAAAPPGIPQYIQPAVPYDYGTGRGGARRRGGSRNGRGRGGGRGGGRGAGAPGAIPPPAGANVQAGAIPPPAGGGAAAGRGGYQSNRGKWYNNWNYCYSCGYDVPHWHTSASCPETYRKSGHQVGCTREMVDGYLAAGHRPSKVARHKDQLPANPQANQA